MARKRYSPEQIIRLLREAEVFIAEGMTAVEAARKIGVSEQTYYRWRKEYGGMQVEQAKRLKTPQAGEHPTEAFGRREGTGHTDTERGAEF